MYQLPLFPLQTILFPGMPIELHIFEPRYRLMIGRCIEKEKPFGVVLIRSGQEANGPLAEPFDIGCSARVTQVEPLKDGRMNIVALGDERFRIHAISTEEPYLMGDVECMILDNTHTIDVLRGAHLLEALVRQYVSLLHKLDLENSVDVDHLDLPYDPMPLMYLAATLLQVPPQEKQPMLEAQTSNELLLLVYKAYQREVSVLQAMLPARQQTQRIARLN